MDQWAAFVGLTGAILVVLLVLSHLSSRLLDEGRLAPRDGGTASGPTARERAPVVPRFEPAEAFDGAVQGPIADSAREAARRDSIAARRVEERLSTGALLVNVALTQGLFGAILLGGAVLFSIPAEAFGLGAPVLSLPVLLAGTGFGLVLWLGNELAAGLADAAGVGYDESVRAALAPESAAGWVLLCCVILPIIAVVEELIFRGAAIGVVAAGFGVPLWLLVGGSSVAFGAAHGAQGPIGAVVAGLLGLALAGAFVVTGSLVVVILAHYLVNVLEFVVHEGIGLERPLVAGGAGRRRH